MRNFNKRSISFLGILMSLLLSDDLKSQGCSDAGFCTIPLRPAATIKNNLQTELSYHKGEESTQLLSFSLSYAKQIARQWQWDHKLVLTYINGHYGTVMNLGDYYTTIRYGFKTPGGKMVHILGGIKLPLNQSNLKINNISLPMVYQTSLGTYDLIIGSAFPVGRIDMNLAVQAPLIQQNRNSFIREQAPLTGDFPTTNLFRRKADLLCRAGYPIKKTGSAWSFNPNLLAIYHLGNDSYENVFGKREKINGSSGITLNANLQIGYRINQRQSLQLSLASPLIVRETRPDGLTRSFVGSVAYTFGW